MKRLTTWWQWTRRRQAPLLLVLVCLLLGASLIEPGAGLSENGAGPAQAGYLVGRVFEENGRAAEGAELFFKVQNAFGASCFSKECESFQKAIFREHLVLPADGAFEIQVPGQFLNSPAAPNTYVYTVVVRTTEGLFRPFYAFKLSSQERVVNDFILRPPFLDTAPGGEDEARLLTGDAG